MVIVAGKSKWYSIAMHDIRLHGTPCKAEKMLAVGSMKRKEAWGIIGSALSADKGEKWFGIATHEIRLLGAPYTTKAVLAASPTEWQAFGLNGAAVPTGKYRWSRVVHLGLVLYGAA